VEEEEAMEPPEKIVAYDENGKRIIIGARTFDYTYIRPKSVFTGEEVQPKVHEKTEAEMNKLKIERIKKLHADLIFNPRGVAADVGQDGAYSHNRPASLSVYDNSQPVAYRPFSSITARADPDIARKQQLQEIDEVKKKLAKFKIKVPVHTLQTSIMLPEIKSDDKKIPLPDGGSRLMVNPFFKDKKKKKGKKKKK